MAILTVDTLSDIVDANDGVTSLREAINAANNSSEADTIVFDASLLGGTIELTNEFELNSDITIDGDVNGDNIADITLLAAADERVFYMDFDTNIVLNSLTITGGYGFIGGNIYANEVNSLTIRDSSILGGYSYYGGGIAIFQDDGQTFNLINSLVANNSASDLGGGVYIFGVSGYGVTNIYNSTLTGNYASTGGGIASIASEISVHNSTIVGNEAFFEGGGVNIDEDDTLVLTNSVIAENTSIDGLTDSDVGGGPDITAMNSFFGSTVIITTDNGGNTNNGGDAGLGALGDQGGTVDTLFLEADSALIGAGSVAALPADVYDVDGDGNTAEAWSRDGTGNSRVVHELDIGASEFTLGTDLVVSTLADEDDGDYSFGDLSLREAINTVRDGGSITFDSSLAGGTITLTEGVLTTARDLTIDGDIDGDNAADITISGGAVSGVLDLADGTHVISSLTFTDGNTVDGGALNIGADADVTASDLSFFNNNVLDDGGAIFNEGTLSLFNAAFGGNSAGSDGGAVYNTGELTLVQATLAGNSAGSDGGAIFAGGEESILNSTLTDNDAANGGALSDTGGAATLTNSIIAGNSASAGDADVSGSLALVGGNIVGGDAAAIFGSNVLADNGGTVQTVNIISGSAAQGAGDLSALPADSFDVDGDSDTAEALPLDANGESRSDDGALDLGAVDYIGPEFEGGLADGSEAASVSEDAALGTVLIDVDANDGLGGAADAGVSYSIVSGNTGGTFAIDSATGVVTLADASLIDVETGQTSFDLVVQADNGEGSNNLSEVTLNVSIDDVAETFVVTTLSDVVDANDGLLSLREAIEGANNGDAQETILFDSSLDGGTLTLGSTLFISEDITLDGDVNGDNSADISISGTGNHTIFHIDGANTDARLLSLTLTDGANLGAVYADDISALYVFDSTIENSSASLGGAITAENSDVIVANSLLHGNSGTEAGGVYLNSGALSLINSFVVDNTASAGTGGVTVAAGIANLVNSTIADNAGAVAGGVDAAGVALFVNTAVNGNTGGSGNDAAQASNLAATNSFFDASVSISIDNGGNINDGGDAGLTALFDRGATTLTLGHSSTSPLVDAGSNAALPNDIHDIDGDGNTSEALPVDGRGARIQNGTVDIGAVEQTALETLTATNSGETIIGSGVSDTINALAGNDLINAGGGDDIVNGGDGNDNLRGDAGNDELNGGFGADILRGGAGADVLNGGAGTDVADYTTSGGAVGVTVNLTTNVNTGGDAEGDMLFFIDRVNGSSRADHITGNARVNYLRGFAQDDTLIGGSGNDFLQGDAGADTLDGGAGTNDWAYYASSSVGVTVSLQDTSVNTGEAIGDTYVNIENLLGSRHDDNLTGDAFNNFVRGLQGDDNLFGGDGNDFLRGDQGADHHDGGAGVDWAYYATSSAAVTIDLAAGTASGGDAAGDTFSSIERVYGSSFADSITGDSGANYLRGSFGGDTLIGGDGDDFLQGDSGFDVLDGGNGSDWALYASSTVGVTISLSDSSQNTGEAIGDTYISIENIIGSRHDDTITGDAGNNTLRGFLGDDTLNGGLGDDILRGEAGNDTFVFTDAAWGDDTITDFSDGNDMLDFSELGYDFSDFTVTQVGNDTLLTLNTDTDQTLLLQNFDAADLDVADFM